MKRYHIVHGDRSSLEQRVERYLNDGWELVGGLTSWVLAGYHGVSHKVLYAQAVTKEE